MEFKLRKISSFRCT